jgi:Sec-independent protein translocase protein TatA
VGFGTLLFVIVFGFLVLGPKQMSAMLGHVARAKAEFDKATRSLKSQLKAGLDAIPPTSQGPATSLSSQSEFLQPAGSQRSDGCSVRTPRPIP